MTTATKTETRDTRTIQVWPRGNMVTYEVGNEPIEVLRALRAERYVEHEVLCRDSALVDDLIRGEAMEGFSVDEIHNLYPDPSDWDRHQCEEWLVEHGVDVGFDAAPGHLRDMVRDNAEPAEVYEWWRVSKWLCVELDAIGEVIIDNGYGCWWGRTCTGQPMIMDGTLQKIAKRYD